MRVVVALACVALAEPLAAQIYAIHAGAVIDPARGTVDRGQTVVVTDGRITAMGPQVAAPAGATPIDLSKEWLMPGLMDAHTHLTLTEVVGGSAPFESFYILESTAYRALRGLHNAMDVLGAGFTTVRDVGNAADYAMDDVRRAIDGGWYTGPTIITSGKIIAPYGGQSHGIPPEQGRFWKYEYLDADSPDEMRKAVRANLYQGAGVIKLVLDNNRYHYSVDEIRVAVEEAHHAGVPVSVHVFGGEAADNAIEAGVDSIEHGFFLTDAQLKRLHDKGIVLVSTDFPRAHLDVIGTSGGILPPPEVLAPKIIDRLRRAHRLGVRLVFGSDTVMDVAGRSRADLMFDYLAVWREAGVPAAELLKAMTSEAAKLLRVEGERGRLAVGLAADLVAMPADPLADTESLRRIDFVMKNGHIVRQGPAVPQR
ncbi:MAG TPA: amidohydrolase family protein [Steroidobacteraceae bacterium]|nr:amidohydrolase family protein [Steroidobacteraceae bacterium]